MQPTASVLSVHPTGERVLVAAGETILEALYHAGYAYRIGCRRGGCGVCKVDLLSGRVSENATISPSVLAQDERAEGIRLSCRAVPHGPVTIALRANDTLRRTSPFLNRLRSA